VAAAACQRGRDARGQRACPSAASSARAWPRWRSDPNIYTYILHTQNISIYVYNMDIYICIYINKYICILLIYMRWEKLFHVPGKRWALYARRKNMHTHIHTNSQHTHTHPHTPTHTDIHIYTHTHTHVIIHTHIHTRTHTHTYTHTCAL